MASLSKLYNLPEEFPTLTLGPQNPPNWSELPFELLTLILHRLPNPFSDHVRFGAVCQSWRYLFFAVRRSSRPPPLLLVKLSDPCQYQLFNLTLTNGPKPLFKALAFKIHLAPNERLKQFFGPSNGWLLVNSPPFNNYFLNPLSNMRVHLPLIPLPWSLSTVAVSPDGQVVAHIVFNGSYMLMRWRPGDEGWRWVLTGHDTVFSLTLTKENRLYMIYGSIVQRHMLSFPLDWSSDMQIPPVYTESGSETVCPLHFVEGAPGVGEVLMVAVVRSRNERHRVLGFRVFRLEMGWMWVRVRSLGEGRVLLVSNRRSELLSKGEAMGSEFEGDCVYYHRERGDKIVSVFSLSEERFKGTGVELPCKLRAIDWFRPAKW